MILIWGFLRGCRIGLNALNTRDLRNLIFLWCNNISTCLVVVIDFPVVNYFVVFDLEVGADYLF